MIFTHAFANSPASLAAIEYSIRGPAATFSGGPLAGAEALVYAADRAAAGDYRQDEKGLGRQGLEGQE